MNPEINLEWDRQNAIADEQNIYSPTYMGKQPDEEEECEDEWN